ncbi:MAG: hypothetical protein GX444_14645 [Myxococcales bacterium]|nr:hypothetical protein [Myxococcales bacterium]
MIPRPNNRRRPAPWLLGLCLLLALACSSLKREVRDEYAPWREVREGGLEWRAPERFVRKDLASFVLYQPASESPALPFVGVGNLDRLPAGQSAADLLQSFRPRRPDEAARNQPAEATVAGRPARGYESADAQMHGWTFVIEEAGKPRAVLLIGVPAYWSSERAGAFRDVILASVRLL